MSGLRTLVVWCPDWPVVAAGVPDDAPAAVMSGDGSVGGGVGGRVLACSAAARTAGVRRGTSLRQAQHRCPQLRVFAHDPAGELRAFETVLAVVETFVPQVEIVRPGLCAFRVSGPARYFGGEEVLAGRVAAAVDSAMDRALGRRCGVGVADGLFAADLAARCGQIVPSGGTAGFLAPWPVGILDRPELAGLLVRLGIHTLGEFAALPAGDVLARFGPDGAHAHRLARGSDGRPAVPRRPPPDLTVQTELDPPTVRVDTAAFAAKALADELHARLVTHGLACTQLGVEVETVFGERLIRVWRHDGLTAAAVADRVRWQLEGWLAGREPRGGSGAGEGLSVLRIAAREVAEAGSGQLDLWGDAVDAERAVRVLARVQGLLGADGVVVPVMVGGRDPATRVHWVPWGEPAGAGPDPKLPWPARIPPPSPAVIHPDPLPAEVTDTSGVLVAVSGRGVVSAAPAWLAVDRGPRTPVSAWAGPWIADERWWDPAYRRRRARFQLVTAGGAGYLAAVEGGRWWVEGTYD